AVVDHAVAVVVEPVAGLGGRLLVLVAGDGAARARGGARGAEAEVAGVGRHVAARVPVVDLAVAVVVEAVSGLGRGQLVLVAGDGAVGARRRARGADTEVARVARRVAAGVPVVDHAVAVVVEPVARLRRGLLVLVADDGAARARGRT